MSQRERQKERRAKGLTHLSRKRDPLLARSVPQRRPNSLFSLVDAVDDLGELNIPTRSPVEDVLVRKRAIASKDDVGNRRDELSKKSPVSGEGESDGC